MKTLKELFNNTKNVSNLQMSLTLILVLNLILSNIIVVKSINLLGLPQLANTCAVITFPLTYVLSDIFSEVYGYKWSRITATWAFIGTILCSLLFQITILMPGNDAWTLQNELISILGNTPQIALASVLAFWFGDFANDIVFKKLKEKHKDRFFGLRAIGSSIVGKYVDGIIFTFIGLSFLPLSTKITMVITAPFVQIIIETLLLPLTYKVANKIKRIENIE